MDLCRFIVVYMTIIVRWMDTWTVLLCHMQYLAEELKGFYIHIFSSLLEISDSWSPELKIKGFGFWKFPMAVASFSIQTTEPTLYNSLRNKNC